MGKDKSGADGEEFAEDWGICEMPWQMAFSINICQEKLTLETEETYFVDLRIWLVIRQEN